MRDAKGENPVSGEDSNAQKPGHLLEMPWVLISNQISQLNERFNDINERFNDVNGRFNDMNARIDGLNSNLSRRFQDGLTNLSTRVDDLDLNISRRIDGLDKRMDSLDTRLANRYSVWATAVTGIATATLGYIFGRSRL